MLEASKLKQALGPGNIRRLLTERLPLPDEPYFPPTPPWPPNHWSQARWNAWWQALARWCAYREARYGDTIPPLPPPPPLTATAEVWMVWWAHLRTWGFPFGVEGTTNLPEFPATWLPLAPELLPSCVICQQPQEIAMSRACPQCGYIVCRRCLYLSGDICPVDGYQEKG